MLCQNYFILLLLVAFRTNFTHGIELYNNMNLRTQTLSKNVLKLYI